MKQTAADPAGDASEPAQLLADAPEPTERLRCERGRDALAPRAHHVLRGKGIDERIGVRRREGRVLESQPAEHALLRELVLELAQGSADTLKRILHAEPVRIRHPQSLLHSVALLAEERILETAMAEAVDGKTNLIQSIDGLVDPVVQDLKLANVDSGFHARALPVELPLVVVIA